MGRILQAWLLSAVAILATAGVLTTPAGAEEMTGPVAPAASPVEETLEATVGPVVETGTTETGTTAPEAPPEEAEPEGEEAAAELPSQVAPPSAAAAPAATRGPTPPETTATVPSPARKAGSAHVGAPSVERNPLPSPSSDADNSDSQPVAVPEPSPRSEATFGSQAEATSEAQDPTPRHRASRAKAAEPTAAAGSPTSATRSQAPVTRAADSSPPSSRGPRSAHSGEGSQPTFRLSDLTPGRSPIGTSLLLLVLFLGILAVALATRRELGMGFLPRLPRAVRHRLGSYRDGTRLGPAKR